MPLQNIKGSSASLVIINFIFPQIHVLFIEIINLITPKKKETNRCSYHTIPQLIVFSIG
jgi:hypothetical protein